MEIVKDITLPKGIVAVIAAVEGFGKTTTLAKLPNSYFIDVDEGTHGLDVPRIKIDGTVAGMMSLIAEIRNGKAPADMKNLCIDTGDKLATILSADLCRRNKWENMEHFEYGKCWNIFKPEWERMWDGLKSIARDKGINIWVTVHIDGNKTFVEKTTGKTWNRWAMRMTPKCAASILEASDLFITGIYDTPTFSEKKGRTDVKLAGDEKRICFSEHSSSHDGKCRLFIRLKDKPFPKSCTLNELQNILPEMLENSTVSAMPVPDMVKKEFPKAKVIEASVKVSTEIEDGADDPDINNDTEPLAPVKSSVREAARKAKEAAMAKAKTEVRPLVKKLLDTVDSYNLSKDKFLGYARDRFTARFGGNGQEDYKDFPDNFIEWLLKGMEKIISIHPELKK